MDEAALIDWYEVVEAVANGRLTGHVCPKCGGGPLETSNLPGGRLRIRCPACAEGFEGRLSHGRDDALYAEADALLRKQEAARRPVEVAPVAPAPDPVAAVPPTDVPPAKITRDPPWDWQLKAGGDVGGLADWMEVITAIHNGRRTGLVCPYCSEPLERITVQEPFIRVACSVCNEGFEGRVQ